MKKKLLKYTTVLLLMISVLGSTVATSAATYETWSERGIKHLCWSKDTVRWTRSGTKIKNVDTNQKRSGFLVNNNGIKKEKTRSKTYVHRYLCKHTLLVGAVISGVTLGWNTDINDRVSIWYDGSRNWYYDV